MKDRATSDRSAKDKAKAIREARLAAALRANLRRRKAGAGDPGAAHDRQEATETDIAPKDRPGTVP